MSWPNTAQRADWHATNNEAGHAADVRYGTGHRPGLTPVGAYWAPTCGCGDAKCTRAEDDSRRLYPDWDEAYAAAVTNLTENEHGPSAGQETTP